MASTDLVPLDSVCPADDATNLEQPIADLLRRVPERWADFSIDALSERESHALLLLVAAEMIERRCHVRMRMLNQPLVVEATFTATGEYGAVEALAPLVASVWEDWQAAYALWREGDAKDVPPFHCERIEPSEWRLTASGVLARKDLSDGRERVVYDFVLRRWPLTLRPPVRGHGRLVKFDKVKSEAVPSAVAVTNWQEGAAAIAEAFGKMYEALHANGKALPVATGQSNGKPNATSENRRDGRNLETERRLQRYLRDRDAQYQRLVEAIIKGDTSALRRFKDEFGPTAFARFVTGETGGDHAEFKRNKTAVQHVQTYLDRIKPVLRGRPPKDWERGKDGDAKPGDAEINAFLDNIQRQARGV